MKSHIFVEGFSIKFVVMNNQCAQRMEEHWIIIISTIFGAGGIATAVFSWWTNRKKDAASVSEKLTQIVSNMLDVNDKFNDNLMERINLLESEVKALTQQNEQFRNQLAAIGDLILKTDGDVVKKDDIARLLK